LLDNALKYSPERTKITVTLQEQEENVLITVADEGEGIPEEQREKCFKIFTEQLARQTDWALVWALLWK